VVVASRLAPPDVDAGAAGVVPGLVVELLDDPQPAHSASAQQAITTELAALESGDPVLDGFTHADDRTPARSRSTVVSHLPPGGGPLGSERVDGSACRVAPTLARSMTPRHFLTGTELSAAELEALLDRALELKRAPLSCEALAGLSVALIFQKPSTRTRVSFEVGIHELGGHAVVLRTDELQLSRGEAPRDTALVLSRHVAAVGLRTGADTILEELAADSSVPVINMLSARHHPCQALADLLTLREACGTLEGLKVAYVGDGNNVARSLALLGALAGAHVAVASPPGYSLQDDLALPPGARGRVTLHTDPQEAVRDARAVYTDVWVSMGDEDTAEQRRRELAGYRVDDALLDAAAPGAFAMHDLPAHPGEEITAEVLYGPRQHIWDQAENRRHAQKALLELLVRGPASNARR
jgi:ornithine carbamoyltransferase